MPWPRPLAVWTKTAGGVTDVFTRFAILDRGDPTAMATQRPILDGGFDQRQIVFGVTYHTRSKSDGRSFRVTSSEVVSDP